MKSIINITLTVCFLMLLSVSFSQTVTQAEYFWDTDPGQGLGTPLTVTDGSFDEAVEEVFKNISILPSIGAHTFNIRIKDANNVWSPLYTSSIYIASSNGARNLNIVQAEYFWDSDPGQGAATPLLAVDGNLDEIIESVYKDISVLPPVGAHTFNVRVKDANNNWSPIFTTSIYVQTTGTTSRDINVVAGELYFDTDPGYGSGMPLLALDGNFNHVVEQLYVQGLPSSITAGLHSMHVRMQDANGNWGPEFVTTVSIDTTIYPVIANITEGDTLFCSNELLTNQLFVAINNPLATYTWSVTNGSVSSGQGNDSVYINWSGSFPATIKLKVCEGANCDSTTKVVDVKAISQTTINDSICQGSSYNFNGEILNTSGTYYDTLVNNISCDSIITLNLYVKPVPTLNLSVNGNELTATSGFSSYNWYFNGNIISGADSNIYNATQSGGYVVEAITSSGCTTISGTYNHTLVTCIPTISITSSLGDTLCSNENVVFTASITDGGTSPQYQWIKNGINVGAGSPTYSPSSLASNDSISCVLTSNASCATTTVLTSDTIVITINSSNTTIINDTICNGGSYSFKGQTLTTAGTYYDSLDNQFGCDSIVTLNLTVNSCSINQDSCSGLIISEYIEGSSFNKAIEIFNASNLSINLSQYQVKIYSNGGSTASSVITLAGNLAAYSTYVVANTGANAMILGQADQTSGSLNFSGNDAVSLEKNDTIIDLIGVIGQDPGPQWGNGTKDHTLVRKSSVLGGVNINPSTFDPIVEWDIYGIDVVNYIAAHNSDCSNTTLITVKEILTANLYPNPTFDDVKIEVNSSENDIHYEVFDSKGKLITNGKFKNTKLIRMSTFERGIYHVKLFTEKSNIITKKIVKQ